MTTQFYPPVNSFPDKPTASYYDQLVNAAGEARDLSYLHYLLNKRVKDCCFNTTNTFTFITNTQASLSVLDDLSHTLSRLDRGYTRKSAYDALINRLCKLERVEEALRVVEAMAIGKCRLNACSFHPMLHTLARSMRMDEAWRVVVLMRKCGAAPDLTAYNYLLNSYCLCGDLDTAAGMLSIMEKEGLKADSRTYNALVLGTCKAGKVEGALKLLRRMADDGVPQLRSTNAYVVDSLLIQGFYAQAIKFVMAFSSKDTSFDTQCFGSLACKLVRMKKFVVRQSRSWMKCVQGV